MTIELAGVLYEVREGEQFAVLTVHRTGDLTNSARVDFTTVKGTAVPIAPGRGRARADYTTTSGTIVFRSTQDVQTIRVPIQDDNRIESDETFRVILRDPADGAVLGANASADVVIHDNDPSISFAANSSEWRESAGRARRANDARIAGSARLMAAALNSGTDTFHGFLPSQGI